MRRIAQQEIAFLQRLTHQTKFTIFKIAQPTMDHPRQRGTGPRTKIPLFKQHNINPLKGKITEHTDPVDPAPNHHHRGAFGYGSNL